MRRAYGLFSFTLYLTQIKLRINAFLKFQVSEYNLGIIEKNF